MQYHYNLRKLQVYFLFIVLVLCGLVVFGGKASADVLPNAGDFSSSVRLLVGYPVSGAGINNPNSIVKIYSSSPTITITIGGFGQCDGDGYDYQNPGRTTYYVFRTDGNENRSTQLATVNNGANCSVNTRTFSVTHGGARSNREGHKGFFVFEFQGSLVGSSLGFNGFTVSVPGAMLGYSRDAGDKFAIKSQFNTAAPTYSTYTVKFAPNCELNTNQRATIRWFDADQGAANQLRQISFDLYDDTAGSYVIQGYTNLGGNNFSGYISNVLIRPHHKYRWIWRNVSSFNGIQFQTPYDSIYYDTSCYENRVSLSRTDGGGNNVQRGRTYDLRLGMINDGNEASPLAAATVVSDGAAAARLSLPPDGGFDQCTEYLPINNGMPEPSPGVGPPGDPVNYMVKHFANYPRENPYYCVGNSPTYNPPSDGLEQWRFALNAIPANSTDNAYIRIRIQDGAPLGQFCLYPWIYPYQGLLDADDNHFPLENTRVGNPRKLCLTVVDSPPSAMSCRSLNPRSVEVGSPFAMRLSFNNLSPSGGPTITTASHRMSVTGPQGYSNTDLPFSNAPPGSYGEGRAPPAGDISITALGSYDVTMVLYNRGSGAEVLRCDIDDDFVVDAYAHPYFEVRGSDIEVGIGAGCPGWSGAGVGAGTLTGWNAFSYGGGSKVGSGTDLAVFALDVIDGVASAQNTTYGSPTASGLTFANHPVSEYGGRYPVSSCPSDYFARSGRAGTPLGSSFFWVPATNGTYYHTGNRLISPSFSSLPVAAGQKVTIYVSGDVRIANNIYATDPAPGNTVANLARFELIVEGNIYIDPDVTQLDGLYVAQPNSAGVGGKIYTCSASAGYAPPTIAQLNSNSATTGCQRTLTVTGAMIARELKLYRSNGSVSKVPAEPAEIFNYTPSMWLSENGTGVGTTEINGSYDSMTSLPPVL